jgi:hypothetical protein
MKFIAGIKTFWRVDFKRWCKSYEWPVVIGMGLMSIVLGYIGFRKHLPETGNENTVWDLMYRTLQLFVIDSGAIDSLENPIRWELNVSRFLAPAVAMYTALHALASIFSEQLDSFRLRFIKNHIIICGLGRKGLLISRMFYEQGLKVVVIEQDEGNKSINICREHCNFILIGNAADKEMLYNVRIDRARYLISVCGDDGINAEVAVYARELLQTAHHALTCVVHIVDPQLCNLLREQEIESQDKDMFRLTFFNIFESGARALLSDYPPFNVNDGAGEKSPHILIVGLGRFGQTLLVQSAKNWRDVHSKTGCQLNMTVIDRRAERILGSLCLRYPQLSKLCNISPMDLDIDSEDYERAAFLFDDAGQSIMNMIYICMDNDSRGLSAALTLYQHLRNRRVPIVIRMTHDAGLANLLKSDGAGGFSNLFAFGLLDRTCGPDLLLGGTFEILARAIHEDYVLNQKREGSTPQNNPSMAGWEKLPEHLKESNRLQANDIGIKLKSIDCGVAPLTDWDKELFQFAPEEVEKLSEMEHERWHHERRRDGWKYGMMKDVGRKISPYLVHWNELPDEIREYDRNTVRGLPAFLARAGFQIYRLNLQKMGVKIDG